VTTESDDNGVGCTLREAIVAANADGPAPGCTAGSGDDEIVLPASASPYVLSQDGLPEDDNASGDLDVKGSVLIRGAGDDETVIDGGGIDRVLDVISGTVEIRDLGITDGRAPGGGTAAGGVDTPADDLDSVGSDGATGGDGGGIRNGTTLMLIRVRVFANFAGQGEHGGAGQRAGNGSAGNAGRSSIGGVGGTGGDGGGIYNTSGGALTIVDSTIDSNLAGFGGDGGNAGQGGTGGTDGKAGGNSVGGPGGFGGDGGGVASAGGSVSISQTEISVNTAGSAGVGGNAGVGGTGGTGTSTGGAGGDSIAGTGGEGGEGGGVRIKGGGYDLTDTIVRANTAGVGASGGDAASGGLAGEGPGAPGSNMGPGGNSTGGRGGDGGVGGGVASSAPTSGSNVLRSAIVQNFAGDAGAGGNWGSAGLGSPAGSVQAGNGGNGGNAGGVAVADTLTFITNSTVAENQAGDAGAGGRPGGPFAGATGDRGGDAGVWVTDGTTDLTHVTVAGNELGTGGGGTPPGGVSEEGTGQLSMFSSLVANNEGDECGSHAIASGVGANLSFPDDGSCPPAFLHGDPQLGPLQNNGGPTPTMALGAGSAALAGAGTGDPCTATDQRGVPRPRGTDCDIGAFERALPAVVTGGATQLTTTSGRVGGTANLFTLAGSHRFQFGRTTAYGRTTPLVTRPAGTAAVAPAATLTGLQPNTLYHYRLVVTNTDGTRVGADRTFRTKQVPFAGMIFPAGQSPAINANRVARVNLRCPVVAVNKCTGTLVLRKKMRLKPGGPRKVRIFGTTTFTIPRGQLVALKVKIKQRFVDLIAARDTRQLSVNGRATATDARGGTPKVTKRPVTLRVVEN
jgi:CSLREA domain-containing protein